MQKELNILSVCCFDISLLYNIDDNMQTKICTRLFDKIEIFRSDLIASESFLSSYLHGKNPSRDIL